MNVQRVPTEDADLVRRCLVGEACDQNCDEVGVELHKVFEESQPVGPGAEIPIEDGQVDGVLVGEQKGRFRVGDRVDFNVSSVPVVAKLKEDPIG